VFPVIEISNDVFLPTYLLLISAVYCFALLWIYRRAVNQGFAVNATLDLSLYIMIGGFVGARLLHVVYENPNYYLENPLDIFKIWQGGFVFYGGALGVLAAALIWLKKNGQAFGPWADLFAPVIAGGYALGRIGCFLAGCCFGRVCHLPWAVVFPRAVEAPEALPIHPTQLYATFWGLGVMALILFLEKKRKPLGQSLYFGFLQKPGALIALWFFLHGWGRVMMEHFRADFRGPLLFSLSISTWLSIGLIIGSSVWILRNSQKMLKGN